ncbi:MAG TPA: hypothetical protein VF008_21275 [Niastella sp.]
MKYKLIPHLLISIFAWSGISGHGLPAMPLPVTYIYGYNNTQIMAEVLNAKQNEVAFTSFESTDKGYWSFSGNPAGGIADPGRTGIKYYDLASGAIQRSGLPAGKYIVSYWSKGGAATVTGTNYTLVSESSDAAINSWEYHEYVCQIAATGSIDLSGNIQIDELRLYPFAAQMNTYTYNLLNGKTSETDINNNSIFYEYDEFARLKCVKDHFGNIRKNVIYHQPGQL